MLIDNNIDMECLQETEIEASFDRELLNLPEYTLEVEHSNTKSRFGTFQQKN